MTQFQSEEAPHFIEHWKSLRQQGAKTLPQSVFLDNPSPRFAPYLYIVEVCETGLFIRLMGTKLVERWGRDRTGESLGHDQPPHIEEALFKSARLAISVPCGLRVEIEFAASNGSQMLVEATSLPLTVADGRPGRFIAYSTVLNTMKYGELSERYIEISGLNWIDIGLGVPEQDPQEC